LGQTSGVSTSTNAYDRLGGAEGVDRLISGFYDRVLDDADLAPFFEHADMGRLLTMQHEFVATALGGPAEFASSTLHHAHARRGIRGSHYVRFLELFMKSLEGAGLDQEDIDRVLERMAIAAPDVIDETTEDG
jgi:hemoglobin